MNETALHQKTLLLLLALITVAFVWILLPFYGAVFWAVILGIVFSPLQQRLRLRFGWRRNLTSLSTLAICVVIAILPVVVIATLLVQETTALYQSVKGGEIDLAGYLAHFKQSLPGYLQRLLERSGFGDLNGLRDGIARGLMHGSQYLATQAFSFGQGTFEFLVSFFVMLYLLFFFLRDGAELARQIRLAIPLADAQKRRLQLRFTRVVRATVKGNLLVAATQGALGGLIFWCLGIPSALLWAVVMGFLSLLPAVGAAVIWVPVGVYFLLAGTLWKGLVLLAFGVLVIGMVDNVLRPILVGRDTKMPDYLILISTLGGMAVFGLNGFVIGPMIAALFIASWTLFSGPKRTVRLPG